MEVALVLSSPHYLMRILRPIIASETLLMRAGQPKMPRCPAVRTQLVGDQQFRREALLLEQLAHQPLRACRVGAEPAYPGSRPRGRRRATDTSACRRSEPPSRRAAIGRSAAAGAAASSRAIKGPNFSTQRRTASWEMSSPRSALDRG